MTKPDIRKIFGEPKMILSAVAGFSCRSRFSLENEPPLDHQTPPDTSPTPPRHLPEAPQNQPQKYKIDQIEGFEPWDPSHEKERAKKCRKLKSRASGTVWASSYGQITVSKPRISIFFCGGWRGGHNKTQRGGTSSPPRKQNTKFMLCGGVLPPIVF